MDFFPTVFDMTIDTFLAAAAIVRIITPVTGVAVGWCISIF